jgi:hypothetical protein
MEILYRLHTHDPECQIDHAVPDRQFSVRLLVILLKTLSLVGQEVAVPITRVLQNTSQFFHFRSLHDLQRMGVILKH